MSNDKLARIIDEAFEGRHKVGPKTKGAVRKAVDAALGEELLDRGARLLGERSLPFEPGADARNPNAPSQRAFLETTFDPYRKGTTAQTPPTTSC